MATAGRSLATRAKTAPQTAVASSPASKDPKKAQTKQAGALPAHPWQIPAEEKRNPAPQFPAPRELTIGAANDPHEAEADQMAKRVLRTHASASGTPAPKRTSQGFSEPAPAGLTKNPVPLLRQATGSLPSIEAPPSVHQVLRSPGQPLDLRTRSFMEPRFGLDFSTVRIHTGKAAEESATQINAGAYAAGPHIVFGPSRYAPGSAAGDQLLAHELAHVAQASPLIHRSPDDKPAGKQLAEEDRDTLGRSYAIVFPQDVYGAAALQFIRKYHPNHKVIRPSSFEQLFEILKADIDAAALKNHRLHVDQLMIVTHANRYGGMMVPLRRADAGNRAKFFTPTNIAALQTRMIEEGKDKKFEETRHFVVTRAIDDTTEIIVRGCEFGRDSQAPDALGLFFGGSATVWAPTDYQGYGPDASGNPTSYYVKGLEEGEKGPDNKAKLKELERQGKTFSPEAESLRMREEDVDTDQAGHKVVTPADVGGSGESRPAGDHWVRRESFEIETLKRGTLKGIEDDAKILMNPYRPENASRLRMLRKAWLDHPEHVKAIFEDKSRDPLFGLFAPKSLFGDPDVIDRDAKEHPRSPDLFEESQGLLATDQTEEGKRKSQDFRESLEMGNPAQRKPGGRQNKATGQGKPGGDIDFSNDPLHVTGQAPEDMKFGSLDLGLDQGKTPKPEYALAARGQFKRAFAIPVARKLGILKNVEAEVAFEGTLAYAGVGQKQINIGGFGMLGTKTNDSSMQTGGRAEAPLYKKKDDQGKFIGVKAGVEGAALDKTSEVSGDKAQGVGRKFEVYVTTEIGWGPVSSEFKVTLFGLDSTKTGADAVKVLEIKISPIVITTPITFECSDGSTATFSGKTTFSIKGEPDWVDIGARLSQFLGRTVAAEAGAVGAAGAVGSAAAGEGSFAMETATALTTGEAIVALGFVAVAAATIYAYIQEVQDIEDLKALKREASKGVDEFVDGYLSGVGYARTGSGRLFNLGAVHGRQLPDQALERAKRRFRFTQGVDMTAEDESAVREMQKQAFVSNPDFPGNVRAAFEGAIRAQFYNAFKRKVGDRFDTLGGEFNIRAASGVPLDGTPVTEPDWTLIFDKGGPRKAPPGHY